MGKKQSAELKTINENLEKAERILEDNIYQLGQMFYMDNCDRSDVDDRYKEKIELITRLEANRKSIYQSKLRQEGKMICESCGAEIPYGSIFCSSCGKPASGQPIMTAYTPQPAAAAYTPQPAAAYTPQPAAAAYAPQPAAAAYAPQPAATAYAPQPAVAAYTAQPAAAAYTAQPAATETPQTDKQPASNVRVCPSCGEPLDSDALFCANCGTRV